MFLPHLQTKPATEPETVTLSTGRVIVHNVLNPCVTECVVRDDPDSEMTNAEYAEHCDVMAQRRKVKRETAGRSPATRHKQPAALFLEFKSKVKQYNYTDGTPGRQFYNVPAFTRNHCSSLQAFRTSKRFGGFANSDFFPGILCGTVRNLGIGSRLYVDSIPEFVQIDTSGFLSVITITIPDE